MREFLPMKKPRLKTSLLSRAERIFDGLKNIRNLSDTEKIFMALGIAATPDERWKINQFMIRRLSSSARRHMELESMASALEHERLQNIG